MCPRIDLKYRSVRHIRGEWRVRVHGTRFTPTTAAARAEQFRGMTRHDRERVGLTPYQVLCEAAFWQSIADAKTRHVQNLGGAA
jgi:hypothetical protein